MRPRAAEQLLRAQDFMLSTDGYGTGEGQSSSGPSDADPAALGKDVRLRGGVSTVRSGTCPTNCSTASARARPEPERRIIPARRWWG